MSGALIGALVLGAGAGVGSYYLNKPKKQDLSLGRMPYGSLTEFPVGASLNDVILKGLSGKDVGPSQIGFGSDFAEKTTSPLVATRTARWKEEELPFLESSLSSRGLSRSTLGARDIGKAEASKERDINEIIGNAYLLNEQQKKLDEAQRAKEMESFRNAAISFSGGEAQQGNIYSEADMVRRKYQIEKEAAFKEAERQNINKAIGTGITSAMTFGGGGGMGSLAGVLGSGSVAGGGGGAVTSGSSGVDWMAILEAITRAENTKKANPFTTQ